MDSMSRFASSSSISSKWSSKVDFSRLLIAITGSPECQTSNIPKVDGRHYGGAGGGRSVMAGGPRFIDLSGWHAVAKLQASPRVSGFGLARGLRAGDWIQG